MTAEQTAELLDHVTTHCYDLGWSACGDGLNNEPEQDRWYQETIELYPLEFHVKCKEAWIDGWFEHLDMIEEDYEDEEQDS